MTAYEIVSNLVDAFRTDRGILAGYSFKAGRMRVPKDQFMGRLRKEEMEVSFNFLRFGNGEEWIAIRVRDHGDLEGWGQFEPDRARAIWILLVNNGFTKVD